MCWKKLPYWVRGGIILAGIYLIISFICLVEVQINYGKSDWGPTGRGTVGYWVIMLLGICLFSIYEKLYFFVNKLVYNVAHPNTKEFLPLLIFIILNSIIYFIIGSIIGWIIGKIKNKQKIK